MSNDVLNRMNRELLISQGALRDTDKKLQEKIKITDEELQKAFKEHQEISERIEKLTKEAQEYQQFKKEKEVIDFVFEVYHEGLKYPATLKKLSFDMTPRTLAYIMDIRATDRKALRECIELLSTDGKNTKQIVKQKLEELVK